MPLLHLGCQSRGSIWIYSTTTKICSFWSFKKGTCGWQHCLIVIVSNSLCHVPRQYPQKASPHIGHDRVLAKDLHAVFIMARSWKCRRTICATKKQTIWNIWANKSAKLLKQIGLGATYPNPCSKKKKLIPLTAAMSLRTTQAQIKLLCSRNYSIRRCEAKMFFWSTYQS